MSLALVQGTHGGGERGLDECVVPVGDVQAAAERIDVSVAAAPRAAVTFGLLLRQVTRLRDPEALAAESAAYSTLLAGPEFARWLATRGPARPHVPAGLRVERVGDILTLTLDREVRRNALDAAVRDALWEGLLILEADPEVRVELRAAGSDFSAGGDLDEFGSAPDPATAHVLRLARSAGALIAAHRDRVTAHVHGRCIGAGAELPAFAGRVIAQEDTRFALPELSLGLIPGAGGTVSITRRIGRWRAAWMGLAGTEVDARTALAWGLVDEIGYAAGH
jgi:enoyl-CoA hydratase/carnithine racemase